LTFTFLYKSTPLGSSKNAFNLGRRFRDHPEHDSMRPCIMSCALLFVTERSKIVLTRIRNTFFIIENDSCGYIINAVEREKKRRRDKLRAIINEVDNIKNYQ